MPRRLPPPQAVAPITALAAPLPPSPLVQLLRKDWRWAAISQFIWTFSDAFGLLNWDIEELETDLDGDETRLLPDLIAKLLYALTYNRFINRSNVFDNLRKQYLKRRPEDTPFGSLEEPVEWATLGLSAKVQVLWELCEWQLEDPARFRALLKSEDDAASWRVDPVGWDKSGNTYWLFDDNRLWIQRLPPAPPRPAKKTSLKAKRAEKAQKRSRPSTSTPANTSHRREAPPTPPDSSPTPPADVPEPDMNSGRRKRTQVSFYGNVTSTVEALKRGSNNATPSSSDRATRSGRATRGEPSSIAKAPTSTSRGRRNDDLNGSPSKTDKSTPVPLGTRVSRRLRNVDDEWQQVPEEWLKTDAKSRSNGKINGKGKARPEEDESELSELTDEEEHEAKLQEAHVESANSPLDNGKENRLNANGTEGSLTPVVGDQEAITIDEPAAAEGVETEDKAGHSKEPKVETQTDVEAKTDSDAKMDVDDKPEDIGPPTDPGEAVDGVDQDVKAVTDSQVKAEDSAGPQPAAEDHDETDEVKMAVKESRNLPEGFVEWEAVCVTLYDWRSFPEQFAKSKDPDEKALYSLLTGQVGPTIIEALVAKEQERIKQEAINNRKRSSRIATKELEKEEMLRQEQAQKEMEERMEKMRREESRKEKEELEIAMKEKSREDRLKEREERLAAREEAMANKLVQEQEAKDQAAQSREERKRRRELGEQEGSATPFGSESTPAPAKSTGERWELACEVCKKTGWNVDEDLDLVCCDDCGRWQHTECHDRMDRAQRRPPRNWSKVDFKCQDCLHRDARKRQRIELDRLAANGGANGLNGSGPAHGPGPLTAQARPLHPAAEHRQAPQPPPHTQPPTPHYSPSPLSRPMPHQIHGPNGSTVPHPYAQQPAHGYHPGQLPIAHAPGHSPYHISHGQPPVQQMGMGSRPPHGPLPPMHPQPFAHGAPLGLNHPQQFNGHARPPQTYAPAMPHGQHQYPPPMQMHPSQRPHPSIQPRPMPVHAQTSVQPRGPPVYQGQPQHQQQGSSAQVAPKGIPVQMPQQQQSGLPRPHPQQTMPPGQHPQQLSADQPHQTLTSQDSAHRA